MPPALTPALALDYVHELSADVRAAVVLDGAGALLAGPPELTDPARSLIAAAADAAEVEAGTADGVVCAVRTDAHAAIAVCGRFAIGGVVRQDLRAALAALEGRAPRFGPAAEPDPPAALRTDPSTAPETALIGAAGALISALQRDSEG
jgi:hypothetical protein